MLSDQIFPHRRTAFAVAFGASVCVALMPASALAQGMKVSVPMSDARGIGAGSVRLVAGQETGASPNVLLLGLRKESWPRVRDAIHRAVAEGYPVRAIFMGPTDSPASLEIYAHGHQVVVDGVDPNTIGAAALTELIRDINREFYGRR